MHLSYKYGREGHRQETGFLRLERKWYQVKAAWFATVVSSH